MKYKLTEFEIILLLMMVFFVVVPVCGAITVISKNFATIKTPSIQICNEHCKCSNSLPNDYTK